MVKKINALDKIAAENQTRILNCLADGPKTWQELLNLTGFAKATLAKHIKKLLDQGLIDEEIDKKDRRRKIYRLNKEGYEALRDELLAFKLYTKLFEKIHKCLYTQYEKKTIKDLARDVCCIIGEFFFLCFPSDFDLFVMTLGYLGNIHETLLKDLRKIVVSQEDESILKSIKDEETEQLLKYDLVWLKRFMTTWKCLAETTPEEMRKALEKFYNKDEVDERLAVYLEEKKKARSMLEALKDSQIAKIAKIEPSEIPTFEDLLKQGIELKDKIEQTRSILK